jgi:septum formation protein
MNESPLILGSTSVYRRELLARLRVAFEVVAPEVDETPHSGERAQSLAKRLAMAKARAVAESRPNAFVIGCDQVADLNGECLGKPMSHDRAVDQLRRQSGNVVHFETAVALVHLQSGFAQSALSTVRVKFRALDDAEIEQYLQAERPYDCAGSAKSEGLGITLLEYIQSDDPSSLIGLPLIKTCELLRQAQFKLF